MKSCIITRAVISILFLTLVSGSTDNSYATQRNRASSKSDSSIDHLQDLGKERKLSAWWNLFTLVHGPCLPGKPGEKCRKEHELEASDNSAADTTADTAAAYDSSASYYSGSDSSSSVFSSYSSENGDEGGSAGTTSKIGKFVNSPAGTATLITLSAVAASVAIAAILLVSRRRKNEGERHALHGTLKRRIGMFQHLASRTKCVTCRPEKASERGDNAADYRLA